MQIVPPGEALPGDADLVILPGSKATLADLAALRAEGWDIDLAAHVRRGGAVLGICGGLQMLGRRIADPEGIEGRPGEAAGLGLLDLETTLGGDKRLAEVAGIEVASGETGPGLRDARRAERRRGAGAADARPGRAARWRGRGRRPGHGLLRPRPVRGRRLPPRFPGTPAERARRPALLRAAGRGDARCAGRPSRGGGRRRGAAGAGRARA